MEAGASILSSMIMYADESVDIRYENGSQLQLSPCGSEFMLARGSVPAEHPLQTPVRVRQRTRFTTSAYKELIITALAFRNKYASRPYLPEELTTPSHKQPLLSINLEVQWPAWSSCNAEFLPGGETIIKSEDKLTLLTLSPSGEEFFVEYASMLSQPLHQQAQNLNRDPERIPVSQQQHGSSLTHLKVKCLQTSSDDVQEFHQKEGKTSCCPQMVTHEAKPEEKYQSVALVQHHSCLAVPPQWCYPLSLALRHWRARVSNPGGDGEERTRHSKADQTLNTSDLSNEERAFLLPQALPLNCSSPHFHRWKFQDPVPNNQLDQDPPAEMVKVMWHQGVTYRILDQDVPVIEVSPGDGSVIRSNGVLSMYFIHYKPECQSVQTKVKEITYHMNGLPPNVPGQLYSVCSVLSCASRLLTRYNEVKKLRIPAIPSCLLQLNVLFKPTMVDGILSSPSPLGQHDNNSETVESRSYLVAAELAKIQRFIFSLEDSNKERGEKGCAPNGLTEITHEPVSEGSIAEALQKTSKAIQDIDAFITAAKQTLSGIAQFDC
ncbi:uncharacterized protein C5orf34 homolog [Hippocampus zosterae]|uniref:uncharacterized protein C5orf34 homolog n=1 Tax=Hippocampus zosterae TaxID=109293 RepID=UPI00223E24B6|nr:uncharacterized protein C5orf34 homolog [Hippocampus zosterae]